MDDIIFQNGGIIVTKSVAKIGNTSYPIANIGSVSVQQQKRGRIGFLITGLVIAFALHMLSYRVHLPGPSLFGLIIAIGTVIIVVKVKDNFHLVLNVLGSSVKAYTSKDKAMLAGAAAAIENAFADKA